MPKPNLKPDLFKEVRADVTFTQEGKALPIFASKITITNTVNTYPTVDIDMAPIELSKDSGGGGGTINTIKSSVLGSLGFGEKSTDFITTQTLIDEGKFFQEAILKIPYDEGVLVEPQIEIKINIGDEGDFGWQSIAPASVQNVLGATGLLNSKGEPASGSSMKFMATSPIISVSKNSASVRLSGVHPISRLNNINFNILNTSFEASLKSGNDKRQQEKANLTKNANNAGAKKDSENPLPLSVLEMIKVVTDTFRAAEPLSEKQWKNEAARAGSDSLLAQLDINRQHYSLLDKLLQGANDNSFLFGDEYVVSQNKLTIIYDIARQLASPRSFLDVLMRTLTQKYIMQFTASIYEPDTARFERSLVYDDALDAASGSGGSAESLSLKVDSILYSLAPKLQLPVNQVVLYSEQTKGGLASEQVAGKASEVTARSTLWAAPEEPCKAGKPIYVRTPSYFNWDTTSSLIKNTNKALNQRRTTEKQLKNNLIGVDKAASILEKKFKENAKGVADFFKQWAQALYFNSSLMYSQVNIVAALDMSVEVGKIYTVSADGGGKLFTGYLHSFTHNIAVGKEAGQATTTLIFRYVRTEGFDDCQPADKTK
jgi:hypothetical protein